MHTDEPPFIDDLRAALTHTSPAMLIDAASTLAAMDPAGIQVPLGSEPAANIAAQLAPVFVEADHPETNAVLRVWAEMLGDDMLRRRVRVSVSTREHPAWLDAIDKLRITRAEALGDVFGEQETLLLEMELVGHTFALACALTYEGGVMLEEAYIVPVSIDVAHGDLPPELSQLMRRRTLTPTEAKQLISQALMLTNMTYPPVETDAWPASKPFLEWVLRLLPGEASTDFADFDPKEEELDQLAAEFMAEADSKQVVPAAARLARLVLDFQNNYGTGDPLRWGPLFVERLMLDLVPRKYLASDTELLRLPKVLIALVSWANARSGIAPQATQAVLDTIKQLSPEYRQTVRDGHPGGLDQLLSGALNGLPAGALPQIPDDFFDAMQEFEEESLLDEVGGTEALERLHDAPLPAESLEDALAALEVPADIRRRLDNIAALVVDTGARYFGDPELVTVALRVLARSAAGDPAIFRRRAKDETAAVAACWIAGSNNLWFDGHRDSSRAVTGLSAAFGVTGSPRSRAETMLRALGVDDFYRLTEVIIGDPELLISERRRSIIQERDRLAE